MNTAKPGAKRKSTVVGDFPQSASSSKLKLSQEAPSVIAMEARTAGQNPVVDERTRMLNEALGEQAHGMSQRAKKRLLKKMKSDVKWKLRKVQARELKAMAKAELQCREAWGLPIVAKAKLPRKARSSDRHTDMGAASRDSDENPKRACSGPELRRRIAEEYKQKMRSGYRVVIDCEFDAVMSEKETRSLVQQVGSVTKITKLTLYSGHVFLRRKQTSSSTVPGSNADSMHFNLCLRGNFVCRLLFSQCSCRCF